jgi:alpha-acetolactate decarboxylase
MQDQCFNAVLYPDTGKTILNQSPILSISLPIRAHPRSKWFPVTPGLQYDAIEALIDEQLPNQNLFYAIRIKGQFMSVKTRSVPGQQKPYPPLAEVTKNQHEFNMKDLSGTIVGFRCPAYVKGINVIIGVIIGVVIGVR